MLYQKQKLAVMNTTQIFPMTDRQKQTKIGQCWIVREGFCTSILQLNYQMFLCMGLCQTNASFRAKSIYQACVIILCLLTTSVSLKCWVLLKEYSMFRINVGPIQKHSNTVLISTKHCECFINKDPGFLGF